MLASASPRRAELLAAAGLAFEVAPVPVDERPRPGEEPLALCERLAREKAAAGAAGRRSGVVLGGDTIVLLDGEVLGKPDGREQARAMLARLSGRRHRVASAVALHHVPEGRCLSAVDVSEVEFAALDGAALDGYLASGEWADKAGAYAIQGLAGAFARLVRGRLDTVVGLPVDLVQDLLARLEEEIVP